MKKPVSFLLIAVVCLSLIFYFEYVKYNDGKLHLVFCNVGQGDAAYVRTASGADILIDGGPDKSVLSCLSDHMPFWDRTIELVLLTHEHADHLNGQLEVLKRYKVIHFATQNQDGTGIKTDKLKALLAEKKLTANYLKKGDQIDISRKFKIETIWPVGDASNLASNITKSVKPIENDSSLVLLFSFIDFNFLITGDATASKFSNETDLSSLSLIKVPHHGAKSGLDENSLNKLNPQLALISVGKNSYGHPSKEVLSLLEKLKIFLLRTDTDGDVEIISDGKSWEVR